MLLQVSKSLSNVILTLNMTFGDCQKNSELNDNFAFLIDFLWKNSLIKSEYLPQFNSAWISPTISLLYVLVRHSSCNLTAWKYSCEKMNSFWISSFSDQRWNFTHMELLKNKKILLFFHMAHITCQGEIWRNFLKCKHEKPKIFFVGKWRLTGQP